MIIMNFIHFVFKVVLEIYVHDHIFKEVYQTLTSSKLDYEGMDNFHLQNRLIYYFNALCIPIRDRVGLIREAHTSKIAQHFGVGKILHKFKRFVYWPKIQEQVTKYIRFYSLCCISKPSNIKLGFYQPLPVPNHTQECISMDFV